MDNTKGKRDPRWKKPSCGFLASRPVPIKEEVPLHLENFQKTFGTDSNLAAEKNIEALKSIEEKESE